MQKFVNVCEIDRIIILERLSNDIEMLQKCKLMDYSLLIAISATNEVVSDYEFRD